MYLTSSSTSTPFFFVVVRVAVFSRFGELNRRWGSGKAGMGRGCEHPEGKLGVAGQGAGRVGKGVDFLGGAERVGWGAARLGLARFPAGG